MAHLQGPLVRLRAAEPADADTLNPRFSDVRVLSYLGLRFPQAVQGFREFQDRVREDPTHLFFIIERRDTAEAIGACDLLGVNLFQAPVFGIWIGAEHWDTGFGTDALRTLCQHAFLDLGLHRLSLSVLSTNPRAQRAYEKVGFRLEGTLREEIFAGGSWIDVHQMGLLASEFEA